MRYKSSSIIFFKAEIARFWWPTDKLPSPLSKIVAPDETISKSTVKVDFFYFVEIFDCKEEKLRTK